MLAFPFPPSTSTAVFKFSGTFLARALRNAFDPSRFEQDFNFGGSHGGVSFIVKSEDIIKPTSTSRLAGASSVLGTSLAQKTPSVTAPAEEMVPKEEFSQKSNAEKGGTKENKVDSNTSKKKTKRSKDREVAHKKEAPKKDNPKVEGAN